MVRILSKVTGFKLKYLYELFPSVPGKGACKIAGLFIIQHSIITKVSPRRMPVLRGVLHLSPFLLDLQGPLPW